MRTFIPAMLFLAIAITGAGQEKEQEKRRSETVFHPVVHDFTRQDTLRGSITPERAWWDLVFYDLEVKVDIENRSVSGSNTVFYKVLEANDHMQIDLQEPMQVTEITQNGKALSYTREGNVFFIDLKDPQSANSVNEILIKFEGTPRVAIRAPWDGGFSWKKDSNGNPFVATSNQGLGASVWWPCKDHMYDEPDSMRMSFAVPEGLTAVGNGRLTAVDEGADGTITYHWEVQNPINNYGVNINIGNYTHFSETFQGEKGQLDCNYYVLEENLEKAKAQFKQVPMMLEAFEYWFGPYPFYEDGFKLVEVPYLGMEHQSSVTYGNHYMNGYMGRDLSGTGWGLKFDFIIIHESGHEWFANNITYSDVADMWIHESFTNYSEGLYIEYHYGKEAGDEYLRGIRRNILNDIPVIGVYDVNQEGSGDMYAKGASMLHTIRQLIDDDKKWRELLRGLNKEFYHATVTTRQIEDYMIEFTGLDLQPVFDQYLRTTMIPTLEYYFQGKYLYFRWIDAVPGFDMPVKVLIDGNETKLRPTTGWNRKRAGENQGRLIVDPDFFVGVFPMLGR